jgi:hypothetical protein
MKDRNLWWGYKHVNGTIQAKRCFSHEVMIDAYDSDFIETVVPPFEADSREEALKIITEKV